MSDHTDYSSRLWFGMTRLELVEHLRALARDLETYESQSVERIVTKIDRWAIARRAVPCLVGIATGHPTLGDGQPIFSSELFLLDRTRHVARTFSRFYRLGNEASPGYWENNYSEER
jgi:hypothetical protein